MTKKDYIALARIIETNTDTVTRLINGKFEYIDKLNFHNQREYVCCGYQIKEYLADTLCEIDYIQERIK